jgi:hypothetical protein
MLPNDDPQDISQPDYGILDYAKQDEPNVAYEQDGLETPKVGPDPYAALGPPARGIHAKWLKVITRPSVATFASEIPAANWGTTLLGLLIFAVFYSLIVITGVAPWYGRLDLHPGLILEGEAYFFIVSGLLLISVLIYEVAKGAGKGTGNFAVRTYLYSLYLTPLAIIAYLLGLVSGLLFYGPLAAFIYGLFLTYYMVQATYGLNPGSARRVVFRISLIPVFAYFSFFIFLVLTFGGF